MDAVLRLVDGRRVGVGEWGDGHGWPVLLVHGTPGSARWRPGAAALAHARERGVELITVSRPGYGQSDRLAGRTVAAWATDAAEVLGALGASADVGVVGVSGGGPHALACGARVPNTAAVAVLAGAGDLTRDDAFVGMATAGAVLWRSAFEPSGALEATIARISTAMRQRPPGEVAERVLAGFPASFVQQLERDPELHRMAVEDLVEAFAGGSMGWLDDARAFRSPWGFDLGEVSVPVWLAHGEDDEFVPAHQAQRLAAQLPNAVISIHSGAGHLDLIATRFNEAVDWLLTQR